MQTQITLDNLSFSAKEDALFEAMTSFKERAEVIGFSPITNEAEAMSVKFELDILISDMQAFSNSLPEGHQRGFISGIGNLRANLHLEEGAAASAA